MAPLAAASAIVTVQVLSNSGKVPQPRLSPSPMAAPALSLSVPRLTWAAKGRVGPRVASLVARDMAPDLVRVECVNNPSFWMVVDLDTRVAHGCVRGCHRPGTVEFTVRATPRGVRVDHALAPWFWLEMDCMRGGPVSGAR